MTDDLTAALTAALAAAPADGAHRWAAAPLARLRDKGLAHDHIRLIGTGALARIPKQSQMDLPPAENLAYQAACFRRAAPSGHTPKLFDLLPPSPHLPRGALLVEAIEGRPASLPADLPAIMRALARIHALPLPAVRAPLLDTPDPLADLLAEIRTQAAHLPAAGLDPGVTATIAAEIARLAATAARPDRPARRLISFDAHPGNYLIRPDGSAVLVDLEKGRYSYPGLDLAHATLYSSTTWDLESSAILETADIAAALAAWADAYGPDAEAARPWHGTLRRAMWLWSITWCAKWRVLSGAARKPDTTGEDWSTTASDAALVAHVRERVDHYLSPAIVSRNVLEFLALEG